MSNRRIGLTVIAGVVGLCLAIPAFADPPPAATHRPRSSGAIAASGRSLLKSSRGALVYGLELVGGTAPSTLTIYDQITAGGTEGKQRWELRTTANNETVSVIFPSPLTTDQGLYVEVEGTGASTGFVLFE